MADMKCSSRDLQKHCRASNALGGGKNPARGHGRPAPRPLVGDELAAIAMEPFISCPKVKREALVYASRRHRRAGGAQCRAHGPIIAFGGGSIGE